MHAQRLEFFVLQTREHSVSTLREVNRDSTSPCLMPLLLLQNDNLPTFNTCPNPPPIRPVSSRYSRVVLTAVLTPLSFHFLYSALHLLFSTFFVSFFSLLYNLSFYPFLSFFSLSSSSLFLFLICAILQFLFLTCMDVLYIYIYIYFFFFSN